MSQTDVSQVLLSVSYGTLQARERTFGLREGLDRRTDRRLAEGRSHLTCTGRWGFPASAGVCAGSGFAGRGYGALIGR